MAPTGGLPHLADASDLERWADTRSAQAELPILVRRLVRAENDQVQRAEFRGGDGVGLAGYDGDVETSRGTPFVPEGHSVWEMGVGGDPEKKAQSDYRSRTCNPLGVDKSATTFVFVTPRRWPNKQDWEKRRRSDGEWRDVRVLDADDLEQALEVAPAVRFWISETLGMQPFGATSIEDWWGRFSRGFSPRLSPGVVLAGRDDQAAALVRRISQEVGRTFIRAATVDDGLAFAACAMLAAGPDLSEPLVARSLLVHDGATLRRIEHTSSLLILLPYEEDLQRDAHLIENHHVIFVVTESDGGVDIDLPPLDHLAVRVPLHDAGVAETELDRHVRAANKSLLALRRVASPFSAPEPEGWSTDLAERTVRRAWLAGAWNQARSGDLEVLEALTQHDPGDVLERMRRVIRQADPLLTKVGGTWAVAAPEDSWRTVRRMISESDLEALERAIQTVLGSVDPRLELPPDERWMAAVHGKVPVHSSDLRKGLARTLALLGARGDEVRLSGGRTAQEWAERVAWRLFLRANEDDSSQLWASMEDVAPLLAEAAPDAFLRALSQATSGPTPLARHLFQDARDDWNVSSPHTGFLWALEAIAWSEQHFGYAAEVLASLAGIDPGGRLSNRPSASLKTLFRPWAPQTSAPISTRVQTLDALTRRHERLAWALLLELLPQDSDYGFDSHRPRFRKWASAKVPPVSADDYERMVSAVSDHVLRLAEKNLDLWSAVIPLLPQLPTAHRRSALTALGSLEPSGFAPRDRLELWDAVGAFVRRHRQFRETGWALTEDWLAPLEQIAGRLAPPSTKDAHRWLFDAWDPDIGMSPADDSAAYLETLEGKRREAIAQILATEGFASVVELASNVSLPWAVGSALGQVSGDLDSRVLALLDESDPRLVQFADSFTRARLQGRPNDVRTWAGRFAGRPLLQARLIQTISDLRVAWDELPGLGTDVEQAYWSEFSPYGRGAEFDLVNEAARHLMRNGRVAAATHLLGMYVERLEGGADPEVVIEALTMLGSDEDSEIAQVSDYDVSRLLSHLKSTGMGDEAIARLEWKFLPLLNNRTRALTLERLLAQDPQVFVEVIELVFRRRHEERSEEYEGSRSALVSNAYRLLREWRVVPGSREDGSVDGAALSRWVDEARKRLEESDRLEMGEFQIGVVLAHAPEDPDGTFPTLPVRELLESEPSDRLERGFAIGLYNKRGVTSRGMTDGGQQEYALASRYDNWAEAIQASHPRTAATLRGLAADYREEGRSNDDEVRRLLEGLDG